MIDFELSGFTPWGVKKYSWAVAKKKKPCEDLKIDQRSNLDLLIFFFFLIVRV